MSHCAVRTRPEQVVDLVFDLFAELHASDDQMDFQVTVRLNSLYSSCSAA
jgi:predicted membrane GTPase involved in stress response